VIGLLVALLAAAGPECFPPERLVTWPTAARPAWAFCVLSPRDSSGASGSGLEIRDAYFNGHPVLVRAHAPVVSSADDGACGCARGWSFEEAPFEVVGAAANDPGASFAEAAVPPRTSCDTGGDAPGSFRGIAAERLADRLILTTHMAAGWHRYTMSWEFRLDGTVVPRFAFAGVGGSCASHDHFDHVYWRFDFDVGGAAPSDEREHVITLGASASQAPGVLDPATRRGYLVEAGTEALTLPPDPSSVGDVWVLRPRPGEITDASAGCGIDFSGLLDDEPLPSAQRVIWYHGSVHHDGRRFEECEEVGPTLHPVGDWSRP
jgi:hypothetical protein